MGSRISHNRLNLQGVKFGRLTAQRDVGINNDNKRLWECVCTCGNIKIVPSSRLRKGFTRSCGCLHKETVSRLFKKHGFAYSEDILKTRFYRAFYNMRSRCNSTKNPHFKNYGGRGIKLEWGSFSQFANDMFDSYMIHIKKYGIQDTSIERVDNNGNYSVNNCKWATKAEQVQNIRYDKMKRTEGALKGWKTKKGLK